MREAQLFSRIRSSGKTYWYTRYRGKQIALGSDEEFARREHHRIQLESRLRSSPVKQITMSAMIVEFLDWQEVHRAPATYKQHYSYLLSFIETIKPGTRPSELTRGDVYDWIDQFEGDGAKRQGIVSVNACLNWAMERDRIQSNPIAKIKKPPKGNRETTLTKKQRESIYKAIDEPEFLDVFTLLDQCGIRPEEARILNASHLKLSEGVAILPPKEHKTGKKTNKPRVIYLSTDAIKILTRLKKKVRSGPLLRHPDGSAWTRHTIHSRFRKLRNTVKGLPGDLSAYVSRHTYVTDLIGAGVGDSIIAEMAGHADPTMVQRVYGHARERRGAVNDAAKKLRNFRGA